MSHIFCAFLQETRMAEALAAAKVEAINALARYLQLKTPTLTPELAQARATLAVDAPLPYSALHLLDPLLPYYGLRYPWLGRLGLGSSLTYAPGVSDPGYFPYTAYGYLAGNPAFTSYRSPRG